MLLKSTPERDNPRLRHENGIEMEPLVIEDASSREETPPPPDVCARNEPRVLMPACCNAPHYGLLMGITSSLMFSLCSLLVKLLIDIPASELAIFRFIGVLLPSIPLLVQSSEHVWPKDFRLLLLVRSVFGTASLLSQFYAFRHMPLADASVIIFSSPAIVAILARVFLKEPCGIFETLLVLLTFGGVVIISRPPLIFGSLSENYTAENWKGAASAFTGTLMAAVVYILLRKLKGLHYSVIMTNFSVVALLITFAFTWLTSFPCVPSCGTKRWLTVALGALSFGGQFLLTKALQVENAGPIAVTRTCDIVFAFIWQLIFFGEIPDLLTIVGAIMVTFSVLILGMRRWVVSMPLASKARQRFGFLACRLN